MEGASFEQLMNEIGKKKALDELSRKIMTTMLVSGKTFALINQARQPVGEIYKIQEAMGLLPELLEKPKKSNEESQKLRVKGNEAYKARDLTEALRLYTRAICCAVSETEEITKAYANRSAVTYELKEYQNSIDDVTHALSTGKYPTILIPKLVERRGKCFLALGQYKRALEDFKQLIILFMQTDIDAEKAKLLKKLIDLIVECVGKQDMPRKQTVRPKLTHEPSSYIQCASSAVNIHFSPKMGRGIVATVDIAPGDILAIEKPFASILKHECWELFCHHCKKRCHSSIPCTSCVEVVFCSDLCRETSWAEYHSVECDILHHLNNLGCAEPVMLAIRTLMKATKLGKTLGIHVDDYLNLTERYAFEKPEKAGFVNGIYMSDHHEAINNLRTHINDRPEADLLFIATVASSIIHIIKESSSYFDSTDSSIPSAALFKPVSALRCNHIAASNLLMRYIMTVASNAYQINELTRIPPTKGFGVEIEEIGGAIYSFYSLQNHSCDPDTYLCPYNGDTLIMIANKPIRKGQEVFGSYRVNYTQRNKLERQMFLLRRFYFACDCVACVEDWPMLLHMPVDHPRFVSLKSKKNYLRVTGGDTRGRLAEVLASVHEGNATEEQIRFLIQQLILIHKHIKLPWQLDVLCQEALMHHIHFSFSE